MITAKTFWNAEDSRIKRAIRRKNKQIRKIVEGQLHKKLVEVKSGSLARNHVYVSVNVYDSACFPYAYETELNMRGFVVIPYGRYNTTHSYQEFHIVIKGFETSYHPAHPDFDK